MTENWKPVKGFESLFFVSDKGNIKSTRSNSLLKPRKLPSGYLRVHLPSKEGKRKDAYIHRLVAEAFCNRPDGCDIVNHKDNNPSNNNADNLEWVTQRENVLYGMEQKRYRINARPVIGCKDGMQVIYDSLRTASAATGCDHSTISKCCKGKMNTTHGYVWRYAEVI